MRPLWLQTPQQLADHLRSFRRSRGLTQAELGRLVGLDQTRVAKIERDPRVVSLGQLMKLLAVLEVRILLEPTESEGRADFVAESSPEWKVGVRGRGTSAGRSAGERTLRLTRTPGAAGKNGARGRRGPKGQAGAAGKVSSAPKNENSDEPVEW
jgi:transcriptional regulator with XRE-family HTH domain